MRLSTYCQGVFVVLLAACGESAVAEPLGVAYQSVTGESTDAGVEASVEESKAPEAVASAPASLSERIWDTAAGQFITEQQLLEQVSNKHYVFLGELFNPETTICSGPQCIVDALIAKEPKPSFVFEGDDVTRIQNRFARCVAGAGCEVRAGKLPREKVYTLIDADASTDGLPVTREDVGLDIDMTQEGQTSVHAAIRRAHARSGISPTLLDRRTAIMRVWYGYAAHVMKTARQDRNGATSVQVMPGFYARKDQGSPYILSHTDPDASRISIAFMELDTTRSDPAEYVTDFSATRLPVDYVWFSQPPSAATNASH